MSQPVLPVLQKKGAVLPDAQPMEVGQFDLRGGVPIIDIPRNPRGQPYDFLVYDNVTTPNGRTLIQNEGTQYAVSIRDGDIRVEDRKNIREDLPFGVIGAYPNDYYIANRQFVSDLEAICK